MVKQTVTKRQKDISRLLREQKEAYYEKLRAVKVKSAWKNLKG